MTAAAAAAASEEESLAAVRAFVLDDGRLVRAVASGRRRNTTVPWRRVEMRYVEVKRGRRLQVTSYDETQAHTRNVAVGAEAASAVDELLALPFGNWHVQGRNESVELRFTKRGKPLVYWFKSEAPVEADHAHDRAKRRHLDESDPLFAALGMTAADGSLKPSRRAKFRQVQDLLNVLDPVVAEAVARGPGAALSSGRPLRVVDLGCGNAYLTFAAFRYLTEVKQVPTRVTGVDLSARARAHNDDVAAKLAVSGRIDFVAGTIVDVELPEHPDLVLALHACDTATDDALARAVRWKARVIIAAPCCHHDLQRQLAANPPRDPHRLITRHGILSQRLADVLTDALRAAVLRLVGYRVEVMEFVDSRHTPRNALIRAVRTGAPPDPATLDDYRSLCSQWQVRPAAADLLVDAYPILGPDS
jgi:SAM-dependent methyltransferase